MRNTILLTALTLLTVVSCSKNSKEDFTPEDVVFSASMSCPLPFEWAAGDRIAVFDGVSKNIFTFSGGAGNTANFSGKVRKGATDLYAVYPADAAISIDAAQVLTVRLPRQQTIAAGATYDREAVLSVAKAGKKDGSFSFSSLLSFVQVTVPGNEEKKLTAILLEGTAGEHLSGQGKVSFGEGPSLALENSGDGSVLIKATGSFPQGNYYIAAAPRLLSSGLTVQAASSGASTGICRTGGAFSLPSSAVYPLGDVIAAAEWEPVLITKEQLFAWNNAYESWSEEDDIRLGADIDMESAGGWVARDGFCGSFDGQGHRIYHFRVSTDAHASFIGSVCRNGVVKDLVFGTQDGEKFDGKSIFRHESLLPQDGFYYIAPIGCLLDQASVSGIVNFSLCENGKDDVTSAHMGGVVALSSGTGCIEDCINRGDIRNLADTSKVTGSCLAGIVGRVDNTLEVRRCSNYGTITSANAYVPYTGGIVGQMNGGGKFVHPVVRDCKNFGTIQNVNTSRHYYPESPSSDKSVIAMLAGVVGENDGGNVIGCENSGAVTSMHDNGQCMMAGIVARYRNVAGEDACVIENCINKESGTVSFPKPLLWISASTSTHVVAGILANEPGATTRSLIVRRCSNYAAITSTHPQTMAAGGIGGYLNGQNHILTIEDCINEGPVSLECATRLGANSNEAYCGGIVGWFDPGKATLGRSRVTGCTNKGQLRARKNAKFMMGGIIGRAKGILVSGCVNNGDLTDDSPYTDWRCVGGIAGRNQYATNDYPETSIENCTNTGKVSIINSKSNNIMTAGGGIIGSSRPTLSLSHCTNSGAVSVSSDGKYAFAGGIWAYEGENPGGCKSVSDCKNTGAVTASVTGSEASGIGAGGIVGHAGCAYEAPEYLTDYAFVKDNYNYGPIATYTGGAFCEGAGALIGFCSAETSMPSAYVSKGVTVNGILYTAAQSLNGWLCGKNIGSMTFDNVEFIEAE